MSASAVSLESCRALFLEALQVRGYAQASVRSYGTSVALFVRYLSDPQPAESRRPVNDIREVDRELVRTYALWLSQRGYSVNTRHMHIKALRRFFEHLESIDAVLFNPCAGLPLPKLADRLPRAVLSVEEARRILDAPNTRTDRGVRDRAILELFYSTGIRGEEMAGLTIQDVDWGNGFVRVVRGKFARGRVVPMGRAASEWTRRYVVEVRPAWIRPQEDTRALWLSSLQPHQTLTQQAIAVMVRDYKKAAGVKRPGRTHLWRHTCATHMVAGGANIAYVQQLLGHRSLDTTQLYTRVAVQDLRAAVDRNHPRSRAFVRGAGTVPGSIKGAYGG